MLYIPFTNPKLKRAVENSCISRGFDIFVSSIATNFPDAYEETVVEVMCHTLSSSDSPTLIVQAVYLIVEHGGVVFSLQNSRTNLDLLGEEKSTTGKEMTMRIMLKLQPFIYKGILNGITHLWHKHNK
ncbi:hypothetical protein SK128_017146 [Halocaridina rubra]|uniref:Uncharacterized protein n=1 Tax=Halocaridina rubra TaxID=373956 RepID=A0AAN8WX71_HALRR